MSVVSPAKCECGRYPIVEGEDVQEFYVTCKNPYCREKATWGKTVEEAIRKWNEERHDHRERTSGVRKIGKDSR